VRHGVVPGDLTELAEAAADPLVEAKFRLRGIIKD
jgi:hypothetical protein